MKASEILRTVHGGRFDHYAAAEAEPDLRGWTDPTAIFRQVHENFRPRDYLEVGSWLGASALRAAQAMPDLESITCVDTWLGGAEHWTDAPRPDHNLARAADGQPGIYEHFLGNISAYGFREKVAPIRLPSTVAAEVMAHHRLAWDVTYLDGSHSYQDVLADCRSWWPLTHRVMIGDDWSDPRFAVAEAVLEFIATAPGVHAADLRVSGNFWMIIRNAKADRSER